MALHKLSKSKSFHVDYCGCTAAALLLNDQTIQDAINFIRQVKSKRDFVKTTITISTDGIKIIYDKEQKYSTHVPSTMIAGSAYGKSPLQDTVGM
jgi:aconitase A